MNAIKKTILVVDDFTSIREFVCETLEQNGYNTLAARNGMEAFSLLVEKSQEVDLVISDYNMPECSGFDLLRKIKTDESLSKIPVIFLTTESSTEKMNTAKKQGLAAWIKKPYMNEIFLAQVELSLQER